MKVITIVVTYNRKELLKECIESLLNQKDAYTDILVIDNNSNDGTEEMIKEYPGIMYENTRENLGGAGGFNYGIKKVFSLKEKYDYIWIMDDDTIPDDNVLNKILNCANLHKNFGFISPKIVWKDGSLCNMNKQMTITGKVIDENTENMQKLEHCSFVACFINREAIINIGLPIKEFFIWCDDSEYTERISKKYDNYYLNECKVVHKMNNNLPVKIESDNNNRIERYHYFYRNRFFIAKRKGLKTIIKYHIRIIKDILIVLVKSKDFKFKRIKSIIKGYFEGLAFNPLIEYVEEISKGE